MLEADLWQFSSLPSERQERIFANLLPRPPRTDLLLLSLLLYFLHFIIHMKSPRNLLPLSGWYDCHSFRSNSRKNRDEGYEKY